MHYIMHSNAPLMLLAIGGLNTIQCFHLQETRNFIQLTTLQ